MKFLLNTAVAPHFCALVDDHHEIVDHVRWDNFRKDASLVYDFIAKHGTDQIAFLGGVSGPGGFSSLRAGACILNALSFKTRVPIHQIRADKWIRFFLDSQGYSDVPFVLNSFSQSVFCIEKGVLVQRHVQEAAKRMKNMVVFVGLLPEEKKILFSQTKEIDFDRLAFDSLVSVLLKQKPQELFVPSYAFSPV